MKSTNPTFGYFFFSLQKKRSRVGRKMGIEKRRARFYQSSLKWYGLERRHGLDPHICP